LSRRREKTEQTEITENHYRKIPVCSVISVFSLLALQRLASGKSRVKIVPPLNEFLASLPAEVNNLPVMFVGKVAEATIKIFDLDAMAEDLLDVA
jgi:hypothetical protein